MGESIIMQGRGRPKKGSTARTLASLGITRDQSSNWQALAAVPKDKFEAALALPDKKSRIRTLNELVRQVKQEKAAGRNVVSHDIIAGPPVRAATMNEESISANVRKKGPPPILDAQADAIFKLQFPDKSRRGRYGMMRFAQIAQVLITFAGEDPMRALGDMQSRPRTLARFPWLLGKPVQHVVLSEMNGLANAEIIATAEHVEKERRVKRINAKQARQIVRGLKKVFRASGKT